MLNIIKPTNIVTDIHVNVMKLFLYSKIITTVPYILLPKL